mmetsp:Transcript_30608/g.67781  ORF Transcript_30608/g.67781 Transcript_30608/m.67781 type:complete len:216 (-) Transcript_30608:218-865(-)
MLEMRLHMSARVSSCLKQKQPTVVGSGNATVFAWRGPLQPKNSLRARGSSEAAQAVVSGAGGGDQLPPSPRPAPTPSDGGNASNSSFSTMLAEWMLAHPWSFFWCSFGAGALVPWLDGGRGLERQVALELSKEVLPSLDAFLEKMDMEISKIERVAQANSLQTTRVLQATIERANRDSLQTTEVLQANTQINNWAFASTLAYASIVTIIRWRRGR